MGLLDEAIREHLDLKRRRGADPAEIERAEREALGPVRRGPDPVSDAPEPVYAEEELPYADDEPPAPAFAGSAGGEQTWAEDEPEPEWDEPSEEHPPLAFDPPPAGREPLPPAPAPEPHPAPGPPASGEETAEYHVEDALAGERDEDVLEETPEFLQDTPDHDRLWFEQRPPRDFDFDK